MEDRIADSLIGLAIIIIGSLGTLVAILTERIKRNLDANTQLTRETKSAANGTLTTALDSLATERNRVLGLRELLREREDRIAFLVARHPELHATMAQYQRRRTSRATEADELAAERRLRAGDPLVWPDDPTGTDAGAQP
jgi:hypothetical protein